MFEDKPRHLRSAESDEVDTRPADNGHGRGADTLLPAGRRVNGKHGTNGNRPDWLRIPREDARQAPADPDPQSAAFEHDAQVVEEAEVEAVAQQHRAANADDSQQLLALLRAQEEINARLAKLEERYANPPSTHRPAEESFDAALTRTLAFTHIITEQAKAEAARIVEAAQQERQRILEQVQQDYQRILAAGHFPGAPLFSATHQPDRPGAGMASHPPDSFGLPASEAQQPESLADFPQPPSPNGGAHASNTTLFEPVPSFYAEIGEQTELIVAGFKNFSQVVEFQTSLQAIPEVNQLKVRYVQRGTLNMEVRHEPAFDLAPLVQAMPGFALQLQERNEGVLRFELDGESPGLSEHP